MVKMRLMRMGRKKSPFYRIVAVDARQRRDGEYIEQLGWYNPVATQDDMKLSVDAEKCKKWLGNGAQPTDTVMTLLRRTGVVESVKKAK